MAIHPPQCSLESIDESGDQEERSTCETGSMVNNWLMSWTVVHEPFCLENFISLYERFLNINPEMTSRYQSGWNRSTPSWYSDKWQPSEQRPCDELEAYKHFGNKENQ